MYTLKVKGHFDAAHYIRDYEGKCSRTHGHRWDVEVTYKGEELDSRNILIDFKDVKENLERLLESHLDHYLLNETLDESNLTAEYLAKWLFYGLRDYDYDSPGVGLASVTIWESPECSVTFTEE